VEWTSGAAPSGETRSVSGQREWLEEIDRRVTSGVSKREFLALADRLQRSLADALVCVYGDAYYAKLIALKLTNFAVAKYHYLNRHVRLASRPLTLMHDPSNVCQLRCPACVHTENKQFSSLALWPAATMKLDAFELALAEIGPFAFNVVYYNYGEPLLNKNLPTMLGMSNGYGLSSTFSTNLSLKFDVDALVAAGPEHMILSIDGATQKNYERFRKRGNLELVLENVRKLVAAKRRAGTERPYLSWQFLTFDHNVHEVEQALALARELGVNEIKVAQPFDVSEDDPEVRVAISPLEGQHVFVPWQPRPPEDIQSRLIRYAEVERAFDESWLARAGAADLDEPGRPQASTCPWLYYNLTLDSAERLMPCCMAPSTRENLVYGSLRRDSRELFNTESFRISRQSFADRAAFTRDHGTRSEQELPFCTRCDLKPSPAYSPINVPRDLRVLDYLEVLGWSDGGAAAQLGNW
jgi:MoaA/NifB/PqqE/SkfB family radical SAM enzyme